MIMYKFFCSAFRYCRLKVQKSWLPPFCLSISVDKDIKQTHLFSALLWTAPFMCFSNLPALLAEINFLILLLLVQKLSSERYRVLFSI